MASMLLKCPYHKPFGKVLYKTPCRFVRLCSKINVGVRSVVGVLPQEVCLEKAFLS